jgi:uncharacterized protein YlxW (UPF0749 family)
LEVWVLLTVAGWTVAGIATALAVREHQVTTRLAVFGGLTPVSGPGVEVVLSDATGPLHLGESPNLALVQDSDLLLLEMTLWYGGARAVAINGARLTARSTILSAGPTVLIDGQRIVGPFHVLAVGDPALLRAVLMTHGGLVEQLRESGLRVQITPRQYLTVPAWTLKGDISAAPTERLVGDGSVWSAEFDMSERNARAT